MSGEQPPAVRWRHGQKVPHHLYRQRGPVPDRRPWPDGDEPIGMFADPADAELAVRAVNALPAPAVGAPRPTRAAGASEIPAVDQLRQAAAVPGGWPVTDDAAGELLEQLGEPPLYCGVMGTLEGLGEFPCIVEDDGSAGSHDGDCETAPERAGIWPPRGGVATSAHDDIRGEDVAAGIDPGPPEPRWVVCAACPERLDRWEPHVAETLALEVLRGRHDIDTREAHPGRRWHPACAPSIWAGAR